MCGQAHPDCGCPEIQKKIMGRWEDMPDILKPDMKSLVWLAIGAFVVPMIISKIR
jgi:hypothetical protein